ncbi:hypothetical protein ACJZ2D_009004 [Fusarium nematophilum]
MTVYVNTPDGLKIWVPWRRAHFSTSPGKLDETVASGVKAEDSPFDCTVAEASEEASLPEDYVKTYAKAHKTGRPGLEFQGRAELHSSTLMII